MASVTGTVALNAAFLQEIKEDNSALRRQLEILREIAADPEAMDVLGDTFCQGIEELRDQLAMHFALEEAFGYFEDAISQAPRLCQRAELLRNEHGELFLDLCELAEQAEEARCAKSHRRVPRRLAEHFHRFDVRLRAHEHAENELIVQAFDEDIGVGD